jgi:hypothetical protein
VTNLVASQNLYGAAVSDGRRFVRYYHHPILANGLAFHDGSLYLSDWSNLFRFPLSGGTPEQLPSRATNIHTLRFLDGKPLLASTQDGRVYWGDDVVFNPQDFPSLQGQSIYLNAAIPLEGHKILISLRARREIAVYDLDERKPDRILSVPFLRNQHHPTPYVDGYFLVSDDSSVVVVDFEKGPVSRSPPMKWPRGIWVENPTKVWVADRHGLVAWNPKTNRILRRVDSPVSNPTETKINGETVIGGALFDVVGIPDG